MKYVVFPVPYKRQTVEKLSQEEAAECFFVHDEWGSSHTSKKCLMKSDHSACGKSYLCLHMNNSEKKIYTISFIHSKRFKVHRFHKTSRFCVMPMMQIMLQWLTNLKQHAHSLCSVVYKHDSWNVSIQNLSVFDCFHNGSPILLVLSNLFEKCPENIFLQFNAERRTF